MGVVWVEQLSLSPGGVNFSILLGGSTHASVSKERVFSAVMETVIVVGTSWSGFRSPTQSTTLMGFSPTWQAQLFPVPASTASGIRPIGRGSCISTPKAVWPVASAGEVGFSFLTLIVYSLTSLWLALS